MANKLGKGKASKKKTEKKEPKEEQKAYNGGDDRPDFFTLESRFVEPSETHSSGFFVELSKAVFKNGGESVQLSIEKAVLHKETGQPRHTGKKVTIPIAQFKPDQDEVVHVNEDGTALIFEVLQTAYETAKDGMSESYGIELEEDDEDEE